MALYFKHLFVLMFHFVICVRLVHCEMFTALVEMEKALHAEHDLVHDLNTYIEREEARLEKLKQVARDFASHSSEALQDPERHLSNPLNAFLLIKRFTTDWEKIVDDLIQVNSSGEFMTEASAKTRNFPTSEDLTGAATALLRLQDTYALPTDKLARGEIHGTADSPELTAHDCFELGRLAYNAGDHYHSILWMAEALERLDRENPETADRTSLLDYYAFSLYSECFELGKHAYNEKDYYHTVLWMQEALSRTEAEQEKTVPKALVLDYLAYAHSTQGNTRLARDLTQQLLELEPDHGRARSNLHYYDEMLNDEESGKYRGDEGQGLPALKNDRPLDDYRAGQEFQTYEALCRGEKTHKYKNQHKLACRYKRHHPIFYICPAKEETMYLDPYINVYHDLMTDSEIAKVKELAAPKLNRAVVQNPVSGVLETAYYRVSKSNFYGSAERCGYISLDKTSGIKKIPLSSIIVQIHVKQQLERRRPSKHLRYAFFSAWVKDEEHPLIEQISVKTEAISNLTRETVEELQVLNYGIGGHYEPHFDFARPNENNFEEWRGNRMATVLYYMTDVTAGGCTVFPRIGIRVCPEKGSMVIWYNLLLNSVGDMRTRHAACPVLSGNKWVCNKWYHERGNEFTRPCTLDPNM